MYIAEHRDRRLLNTVLFEAFKGVSRDRLFSLGEEYCERILIGHLFPRAVELIEANREAGIEPVLVTGSPDFIVAPLARHLRDRGLRRESIYLQPRPCDRPAGRAGDGGDEKAVVVRRTTPPRTISTWRIAGVTPTRITTPRFSPQLGHPVAVNPDRRLRAAALSRQWPVIHFEKAADFAGTRRYSTTTKTLTDELNHGANDRREARMARPEAKLKELKTAELRHEVGARSDLVVKVNRRSERRIIPYGEEFLFEKLPVGTRVIYPPPPLDPLADADQAIRYALLHPENQDPLFAQLSPNMRVTIAIDDISLPLPQMRRPDIRERLLNQVLQTLADYGVDDVHLVIATSLHRRMTEAEIRRDRRRARIQAVLAGPAVQLRRGKSRRAGDARQDRAWRGSVAVAARGQSPTCSST